MSVNLNRNTAIQISGITSSQEALLQTLTRLQVTSFRDGMGTSSGFLIDGDQPNLDIPYPDDNYGFIVSWGSTCADDWGGRVLRINEGTAWQSGLGHLDILLTDTSSESGGSTASQVKRWMVGPLESARFVRSAASSNGGAVVGAPAVNFQMTTARSTRGLTTDCNSGVRVQPFKLPVVTYDN